MDKTELLKLVEEYGTPLMVIDHARIRENYADFVAAMPRVQPYYAVKANPEPEIIRTLFKCGSNFDVASIEELKIVEETILGSLAQKEEFMESLIFANTVKPISSLKTLANKKVTMTFDNSFELDKIEKYCPHAVVILRIDVPNRGAVVELSSKFGAPQEECLDLLKYAIKLGLKVDGLSFHVGSQCTDATNYTEAIRIAREIYDDAKHVGIKLPILDIGGGFPAQYDEHSLTLEIVTQTINNALAKYFPHNHITVIAEPGRFMVANAATSICEVNGKSIRKGKPFYYVNDGVYNSFSGFIFDHIQYSFKAFKDGVMTPSAVVGPTCDALDKIIMDNPLPELQIGDLIYSENTGAYTNASATYFNGFSPAKVIHINTL